MKGKGKISSIAIQEAQAKHDQLEKVLNAKEIIVEGIREVLWFDEEMPNHLKGIFEMMSDLEEYCSLEKDKNSKSIKLKL